MSTQGPVAPPWPPDDGVGREEPIVGQTDRFAQDLLATIGSPAREAGSEPLRARGEQEVLDGGVDRAAGEQIAVPVNRSTGIGAA